MAQSELDFSVFSASAQEDDAKTVTRADLAEALHRRAGFARADAAKYVEMVLEEIFEAVISRDDVKLSAFGAFQIRAKRERQGRNPKTGQEAKITARLVVTFKPSNVLRARVNGFNHKGAETEGRNGDGASEGDGESSRGEAASLRNYGSRRRDGDATLHCGGPPR